VSPKQSIFHRLCGVMLHNGCAECELQRSTTRYVSCLGVEAGAAESQRLLELWLGADGSARAVVHSRAVAQLVPVSAGHESAHFAMSKTES
jgi:hypothetical protein